jgi:hypothetical protein
MSGVAGGSMVGGGAPMVAPAGDDPLNVEICPFAKVVSA